MMDDTVCAGAPVEWMEQLSDHMLRSSPADGWRQVFLGSSRDRISFRQQQQTMLCALSEDSWDVPDQEGLAQCFGGRQEYCLGDAILIAFPTPQAALQTAIGMQRLSTLDVRTALVTGVCTVADFVVDGLRRTVTLGSHGQRAKELASGAAIGTIALCPISYELLEDELDKDARDALVVTEMDSSAVLTASLILPPRLDSGASTFTGLGRS